MNEDEYRMDENGRLEYVGKITHRDKKLGDKKRGDVGSDGKIFWRY
jgi:hypothetical protein